MEDGVDMTVSNKHYNRLVRESKTVEAAAFMSIARGAPWSPARLQEAGIQAGEGGHKWKNGTSENSGVPGNPRKT